MEMKMILVFFMALAANMVEDVLLLLVFNVPITKSVIIIGIIFSLCFMFFYKIIEYNLLKRSEIK